MRNRTCTSSTTAEVCDHPRIRQIFNDLKDWLQFSAFLSSVLVKTREQNFHLVLVLQNDFKPLNMLTSHDLSSYFLISRHCGSPGLNNTILVTLTKITKDKWLFDYKYWMLQILVLNFSSIRPSRCERSHDFDSEYL